jgi:hypothetical protein
LNGPALSSKARWIHGRSRAGLRVLSLLGTLLPFLALEGESLSSVVTVPTEPNLKVAFIGDSDYGPSFTAVLNVIQSEGADFVLHQGDFDYNEDPNGFFAAIDSVLGPNFPYFASIGNHDTASWPEGCGNPNGCYASLLKERMARIGVSPDNPDLNDEMYSLDYRGLKMVFVGGEIDGAGDCDTDPAGYACYIRSQLTTDDHLWKICSWHRNQNAMQVGGKPDEMGWAVYESCRDLGAIIATGHEHSYHRTKTLTSMQNQTVDLVQHPPENGVPGRPDAVRVAPGASFVFVSGLGGRNMREQQRCLPATYPYGCNFEWANIFTLDQAGGVEKFGALFIEFGVDGDPARARGYFKTTDAQVIDAFEVVASPAGADSDGDGFSDEVESGAPLCNGANNDPFDDEVAGDGCPGGPARVGSFSEGQFRIGTGSLDPCGNNGWPLDLNPTGLSTNRIDIVDLGSFVAGVRKLNTNPGEAGFDSRWDLVPGTTSSKFINTVDMAAMVANVTARPPMLGGVKALGGPPCPYPP